MNTLHTSKSKKVIIISVSVLVLAVLITGAVFALNSKIFNADNGNKPTPEQIEQQKQTEADAKKDFAESTKDQELPGTDPETPSSSDLIELSATQDAGVVNIATKLHNFSSGICTLSITNNTNSLSEEAQVLYQPEFSTCAGFSIVKSRLGSGNWDITIDATPSGGTKLTKNIKLLVP